MKITYSIWDNTRLLAVNQEAKSADEILAVLSDLQKVSPTVVAVLRGIEVK